MPVRELPRGQAETVGLGRRARKSATAEIIPASLMGHRALNAAASLVVELGLERDPRVALALLDE